jgi:hypothetical protein
MTEKLSGQAAEDLLKEARDRLAMCIKHDAENRREAAEDFRFFGGEQWPNDMRQLRQVEARPCLTINKLPAFVHQVVNDMRQNRPSIKVHPVDSGADVEVAEVIQGMIRYIEYNSNADIAYDTAVGHAAVGGFGYFRLGTDYVDPKSFDQEIKFRRVQNPFTVYIDPFSSEPDGSDMTFGFVTELISRDEFKRDYPKADAQNAETLVVGMGDTAVVWMSDDSIRIAEYYRIKSEKATLCRLNTGEDVFKDELPAELPDGIIIERERQSERRTVQWFKITGVDVLEQTDIPCKWIPLFPVYGDENVIDGRIRRNGMVRFARDPQRMYNFWMTSATEEVSLRPKTPFIGAVGQFDTAKKDWQKANTRSYSYLEYDPVEVGGSLAPAPQRQPMSDVPTGVLAMAMHASDNIKATIGMFDASLGAQGNETSGRAITARQREGDTANYHFADNRDRTVRHAGRCIVSMIPYVYDSQRVTRMLGEDEKMETAEINKPLEQPEQTQDGAIRTVLNDMTIGTYDVTIGTGPSYSTKRAEFVDAAIALGQSNPAVWQAAGDLIVRGMDWPQAEEIADRLGRMIPAEIKDDKDENAPQQLPPQVTQVLQQAGQEIQQLQQALQESKSGIDKAKLDAQAKLELAQIDTQTKLELARMNNESAQAIAQLTNDTKHDVAELSGMVQLILQKMQPPPQLEAAVSEDLGGETSEPEVDDAAEPVSAEPAEPPKPRMMSITAPSGGVYRVEIND